MNKPDRQTGQNCVFISGAQIIIVKFRAVVEREINNKVREIKNPALDIQLIELSDDDLANETQGLQLTKSSAICLLEALKRFEADGLLKS